MGVLLQLLIFEVLVFYWRNCLRYELNLMQYDA